MKAQKESIAAKNTERLEKQQKLAGMARQIKENDMKIKNTLKARQQARQELIYRNIPHQNVRIAPEYY